MTDEEKKAIKDLKDNIEYAKKCMREDTYTNQETIYIVLNLIKKQQKEMKKYKNLYQKALYNTVKSDRKVIKQQNIIKSMAKELTNLLEEDADTIIKRFEEE